MAWVQQPISSNVAASIISAVSPSPAARTTQDAASTAPAAQDSAEMPTYAESKQNTNETASTSNETAGDALLPPTETAAGPSTVAATPLAAPLPAPVESTPAAVSTPAPVPALAKAAPAPVKPVTATPKRPEKKKSSPFKFLSACFPCFSSSAHTPEPASVPLPAGKTTTNEKPLSEKPVLAPVLPKVEPSPAPTSPLPAVAAVAAVTGVAAIATTSAVVATEPILTPEDPQGVTSAAVTPPGRESTLGVTPTKPRRRRSGKAAESIITSVPEPGQELDDESYDEDDDIDEDEEDEETGLIARGGVGIPIGEDGLPHPLLDELVPELKGRKCLVLDLDETLVHSSFKMIHQADYVVPVEIENQYHNVYVIKRPGVDAFLKAMGEIYEVVIFTASLSKYADPVLDQLDIHRVVRHRLFRESCYNNKGNYVKDLSQLGRPISECIIIDNSPASYVFHPNNAVPISSWFNDPHDTELTDLVPFLTDLERADDIRAVLDPGLYWQA